MSIQINKAVVTRFNKEMIEGRNASIIDELFDPEFVNRTVRPGYPTGSDGVLKFLKEGLWTGLSNIHVEIHDQTGEGDQVTTRKTIHGNHTGTLFGQPATGRKVEIFIIDIVRLRNGKYLEHWGIFDMKNVLAQITE